MVSLDIKSFLLNYVRNCFLISDDTSFCELLLEGVEDVTDNELCDIFNGEKYSPEYPFVPDNESEVIFSRTSNSAHVRELTVDEVNRYFPSKPTTRTNKLDVTSEKSGLTLALEQAQLSGSLKRNKLFSDFAIYDGRTNLPLSNCLSHLVIDSSSTDLINRQFIVWFWRLKGFPRTSIRVQPRLGTSVKQFIGLCLWQYFNELSCQDQENGQLSYLNDLDESFLNRLSLYIFDAYGEGEEEVDSEFPALDSNDSIHKYEFESLALVESVDTQICESLTKEISNVLVKISMAQGVSIFRSPTNVTLSVVLERAIMRRRLRQHGGYAYRLELYSTFGSDIETAQQQKLDLTQTLNELIALGTPLHFVLIRENSRCDPAFSGPDDDTDDNVTSTDLSNPNCPTSLERVHVALQLRQYCVTYLKGLFPREVQLNISSKEVKIEAGHSVRRRKLFSKPFKTISIQINAIADCELNSTEYQLSNPNQHSNLSSFNLNPTGSSSSRVENNSPAIGGGAPNGPIGDLISLKSVHKSHSSVSRKVQFRIIYIPNHDLALEVATSTTNSTNYVSLSTSSKGGHLDHSNDSAIANHPNDVKLISSSANLDTVIFQQHCFETQWSRARAICDQLNMILEVCESQAHRIYMQRKLSN